MYRWAEQIEVRMREADDAVQMMQWHGRQMRDAMSCMVAEEQSTFKDMSCHAAWTARWRDALPRDGLEIRPTCCQFLQFATSQLTVHNSKFAEWHRFAEFDPLPCPHFPVSSCDTSRRARSMEGNGTPRAWSGHSPHPHLVTCWLWVSQVSTCCIFQFQLGQKMTRGRARPRIKVGDGGEGRLGAGGLELRVMSCGRRSAKYH
ncbi:hypothetical protein QBC39DRAFT_362247 [Podospora conica]|nr:hypothetical protein QBC39DRAFT_362247 [Schizothecium conicum]